MNILEEIREYFASTQKGAREIKSLPKEYPAFVIRTDAGYGIAIPYKNDNAISERFANCRIYTRELIINDNKNRYLILSCTLDSSRYEFATVCAQFAEPGDCGIDRINLLKEPTEWWERWKMLLGNSISDKQVYSVIAEMIVLDNLYKKDKSTEWSAIYLGSHDIENNSASFEVKSTIKRYGATITITGQHQLQSSKKLQIYFCRLEKSKLGISVNDMKKQLLLDGYNADKLECQLYSLGYEYGSSKRDEKYKILEKRKYEVNTKFPHITESSFKDNKIPQSIVQITYTIDLDGLEYTKW